ncbi:alpha/beta-hydrolase [Exidia glandulosa HHB12029]|uniref:Alpha/beta-hydrolase n=1 Tax=Exidia glandulosa HHB12029 TaxID=1314781 RepID=A0A165MZ73_EXIGL|nr:alpha/beta-hydrolase [Exidia glandulosa HHB12029]
MAPRFTHLSQELAQTAKSIEVKTRYGAVTGGTAANGAAVFLELPYALPPNRFENPVPLPDDYRYSSEPFVHESAYAVQPMNDGQAAGVAIEDKLGLGTATENPLFLNIVCPADFQVLSKLPVKVYIHGGFLQFGSPHGVNSQSQYVACERGEVWVNVGYRLSAFGFLANGEPYVGGNYGFKDQWLALEWVKANISAFSGNPEDVQIVGLSAGAHSCHQLLHYASRLPEATLAPFQSALLMSNAILLDAKTPAELRTQYLALLNALDITETGGEGLSILSDAKKTPATSITTAIDEERLGPGLGTFRGCSDGDWMKLGAMQWQRSGGFAAGLKAHGVKSIIIGDLVDEWYLYSIAHTIKTPDDVPDNLKRYYSEAMVERLMKHYPSLPSDADEESCARLCGEILSDGQVHLPVRVLARDLRKDGFPVVRYHIKWTPPGVRPKGLVTHSTDRPMWGLRHNMLTSSDLEVARAWLAAVSKATQDVTASDRPLNSVLTLQSDQSIGWATDERWERMMEIASDLGL